MEPVMMFVIAAIIAAILLVMFNKQQESKMSNHLYTNDVQQLYLLTAAEYKINALEHQQQIATTNSGSGKGKTDISAELDLLTAAFESGEIPLNELNSRLDYLLDTLNINSSFMIQAY
jgi:hypothetical protein